MPHSRSRLIAVSLTLTVLGSDGWALGFGSSPLSAVLGRSLDQSITLRVDPGEVVRDECVSAQVLLGERQVPPSEVVTRIESDGGRVAVRVRSSVVVDEPVVSITVGVGCPSSLTRRFVVFADPPERQLPSVALAAPADAAPAPDAAPSAARPRAAVSAAAPASAPVAVPPARRVAAAPRAASPAAAPRRPRAARRAPQPEAARPTAAPARPRLRLDAVDPDEMRQLRVAAADVAASAAEAISQAQAAGKAMAAAASAAETRVAELERAIEKMRAEAQADRDALRALRQRAAKADATNWQPYLLGLVLLLGLLAAWLAVKLRRLQTEQQLAWLNAAMAAEKSGGAGVASVPGADTLAMNPSTSGPVTTRPGTLAPVFTRAPAPMPEPDTEPPAQPVERTQALPVGWRDETEGPRDVSVEELIDLEQQAEFFSVLGQEEAAIDLLVDYLRSTGGGSPMPYLKLLEIYRRRGDREAYDRTRARFNHRFNAYAPDWDDDPAQGRSLEDYPAIVGRLQMAWSSPIDAMAELESLLFRKARGELFDLPAYRDVMFLYSLARDLLDREPLETGNVDVLLPISDGSDFTQPMSFEDTPLAGDSAMLPLDNPPTLPVDLDVTQPSMPESLFGETATLPGSQTRRRI